MTAVKTRGLVATAAAAFASSVIGMLAVLVGSFLSPNGAPIKPGHIVAMIGITLFWAPAIAFIPAAILGFLVERPKAREMIARHEGGLILHVAASTLAGTALAILFRLVLSLFDPGKPVFDPLVLKFFTLIGFCSGLAWWVLVVLPARRA